MDKNVLAEETGKIRNFVFQDLKNSGMLNEVYSYWVELENNLSGDLYRPVNFIRDYLTIQNGGKITEFENLAKDFIIFYAKITKYQSKNVIIKNLCRYSLYYKKIASGCISDPDIKEKIDIINSCGAKDAYPFLMEVFEDYDFAHINKHMLLDILDTVISFIEERNSVSPSQIALSFAGLSKEINKMMVLKDYMPKFVTENPEISDLTTINSLSNAG